MGLSKADKRMNGLEQKRNEQLQDKKAKRKKKILCMK
jgi:hypothetical protein